MPLFSPDDRRVARAVSRIVYCNPFAPDRIDCERDALADDFVDIDPAWNADARSLGRHANITRLTERAGALADTARARLATLTPRDEPDLQLYEDVVLFYLYHQYHERLTAYIDDALADPAAGPKRVAYYRAFAADVAAYLDLPAARPRARESAAHLFAFFFQVRRAFHHIFSNIVGRTPPACRLRAAVWESIFTHDARRYRRALYQRMADVTTLITGPSGTGKELVARAVACSQYIPFDPAAQTFREDFANSFHALSLSALSPTLIESELFGHRRGAFTGALDDRAGWLEVCRPHGAVFLDEVGDVDPLIQVKLLRVLQTRTFQRLGDTHARPFVGKIIAATHRELGREIRDGRFREDVYYRLCSDRIETPSLRELLAGDPSELHNLVTFVARRVAGEEADALAAEVMAWITQRLPRSYPWPGNVRELEQCVRNVLVRGAYRPANDLTHAASSRGAALAASIDAGALTADELLARYCTIVYAATNSYEETARRLALDRRTVKSKVDRDLLATITLPHHGRDARDTR